MVGGVATLHANSANLALRRLEQLTAEASQQPMCEVIGEAVDLVIFIEKTARARRIREVLQVDGFVNGRYEIHIHPNTNKMEDMRHVA